LPSGSSENADGLVCAVAQQRGTGEVLMVAWMDDRGAAPHADYPRGDVLLPQPQPAVDQGRDLGPHPAVHEVRLDCDGDTVLLVVDQEGGACHTGDRTCFDVDQLL